MFNLNVDLSIIIMPTKLLFVMIVIFMNCRLISNNNIFDSVAN